MNWEQDHSGDFYVTLPNGHRYRWHYLGGLRRLDAGGWWVRVQGVSQRLYGGKDVDEAVAAAEAREAQAPTEAKS